MVFHLSIHHYELVSQTVCYMIRNDREFLDLNLSYALLLIVSHIFIALKNCACVLEHKKNTIWALDINFI